MQNGWKWCTIATYRRPWRSWISQWIPIPKVGGSNPSGRAKKLRLRFLRKRSFSFRSKREGFEQGGRTRQRSEENSPVDCFRRRGQRAKRGEGAAAPQNPSGRAKKSDKFRLVGFFYPSRQAWYIITRQRVYHQHGIAVLYLITPLGVYFCRLDDIQNFVLMIYRNKLRIIYKASP